MKEEFPICGIYMIINNLTGEQYIGQSIDILRRYKEHLRPKSRGSRQLHKDVQRMGKSNFIFIILEECSEKMLGEREEHYIRFFHPYYNKSLGPGQKGLKCSEYAKSIIGRKTKERWENKSDEEKAEIIKRLKSLEHATGYHLSEEARKKISDKRKGQKASPETRKKLSEIWKRKIAEGFKRDNSRFRKPIICTTTGEEFESVTQAAERFGIYTADISNVLTGKQKTTKGLHFIYGGK